MVLGTGKERPLSIGLHTDGDPEARFETASLHQDTGSDRRCGLSEVISPTTCVEQPLSGGDGAQGTRSVGEEGSIPSLSTFKFQKTFCSSCGREFGPGNHGFSHCKDHASKSGTRP